MGGAGGSVGGAGGSEPADATSECAPLLVPCAGNCTDTAVDPLNCGACGVSCEASLGPMAKCVSGQCSCPSDAIQCSGRCTRLDSDPLNCGACGNAVDPSYYCVNGAPTCRPRTCECSPWDTDGTPTYHVPCVINSLGYVIGCTDKRGDGSHCSTSTTCQNQLPIARCVGGSVCVNGTCSGSACPAGRIACQSTLGTFTSCFDPKRDSNHCGGCFKQCAPGQTCAQGSCVDYIVVESCAECGSMHCCDSLPMAWAHSTICVKGNDCPD